MTSPTQDPVDHSDTENPSRRLITWITLAAVAALTAGWVYVLFFYDPGLLIDELPDRTFPDRAEQVCAAAKERYDTLPVAQSSTSAAERAAVVAQSNLIFEDMVYELGLLVDTVPITEAEQDPSYKGKTDRGGATEWVEDWAVYLENRQRYAEDLALDPETRFLETYKGKKTKGVTQAINAFAQVNRMNSCVTPGDLS